jgi:hypothetical protein
VRPECGVGFRKRKTPQYLGIYALNRTNITVKNGSISGFYAGIDFDYRSGMNLNANHLVDGVRITNPQAFGVLLTQAKPFVRAAIGCVIPDDRSSNKGAIS